MCYYPLVACLNLECDSPLRDLSNSNPRLVPGVWRQCEQRCPQREWEVRDYGRMVHEYYAHCMARIQAGQGLETGIYLSVGGIENAWEQAGDIDAGSNDIEGIAQSLPHEAQQSKKEVSGGIPEWVSQRQQEGGESRSATEERPSAGEVRPADVDVVSGAELSTPVRDATPTTHGRQTDGVDSSTVETNAENVRAEDAGLTYHEPTLIRLLSMDTEGTTSGRHEHEGGSDSGATVGGELVEASHHLAFVVEHFYHFVPVIARPNTLRSPASSPVSYQAIHPTPQQPTPPPPSNRQPPTPRPPPSGKYPSHHPSSSQNAN
jgi:hypothetical protein